MKYMLMFWVDESAEVTEDDDAAMMIAVASWVEKMTERGILLHGSPLSPVRDGKIVNVRNGELLVSDGPFAETKEQIGGSDLPTWTASIKELLSQPDIGRRPWSSFTQQSRVWA